MNYMMEQGSYQHGILDMTKELNKLVDKYMLY
jgi:hypothetical protein